MEEGKLKHPALSIIMPVYNAEKYLDYSIQSVLNQTYKDYELILVNDGSTDSSLEICRKYQLSDERIRIISQENRGISGARNAGINAAIAEYITFIDNDDIIHPRMYQIMLEHMISEKLDLIMCEAARTKNYDFKEVAKDYEISDLTKRDLYAGIFSNSEHDWKYMAVWNKIYKTNIVKQIRFETSGTEDTVFNCKYFEHINKAKLINQDLYYWIQRSNSVSHSDYGIRDYMVLKDYYWMNQYIQQNEKQYAQYPLIKLYKLIFNSRYRAKNTRFKDKTEEIIKENHKEIKKEFYENHKIDSKIKILFTIFYNFPITYDIFRWLNEKKVR